jgi:NAD-dependent deacetylase
MMNSVAKQIEATAEMVAKADNVLIFTGAGVSTESGIPDFRGSNGIWSKYNPEDFTIHKFLTDKRARKMQWQLLSGGEFSMINVEPNPAHYAIAELEKLGKLHGVVTQNIDGLHQKAGVSENLVFQLHGDLSHAICLSCKERYPMEEISGWLKSGLEEPVCINCQGMLKPDAILFGEQLPMDVLLESEKRSRTCDVCIAMGSTLTVYPAALIPQYAVQSGAKLVIINMGATELDRMADIRIEGKAGVIAPQIIDRVKSNLEA